MISDFLKERGLELSDEKTLITDIKEGFDFLGWNFRKYKGKLLIKPSKDSIKIVVNKISTILLKEGKAMKQSDIIRRLNAVLRGWANYHKHVVSSEVFSNVNNTLYLLLERWAKHRHPNKSKWWRLNRYWHPFKNTKWKFMADENDRLLDIRRIKIVRHPKLRLEKNPYTDRNILKKENKKYKHQLLMLEIMKKCLSRMSGKVSCTVLRRGSGSNFIPLFAYTSKVFKNMLEESGLIQSMSRVGRCIDNGPIEGFWEIIKAKMYYLHKFHTYADEACN